MPNDEIISPNLHLRHVYISSFIKNTNYTFYSTYDTLEFPLAGPSSTLPGSSLGMRPLERNRCTLIGSFPKTETMVAL